MPAPNAAQTESNILCMLMILADRFGNPSTLDPAGDPEIVGGSGIFSATECAAGDRSASEFRKTAAVMKLVVNGYAGAGTITMGGYDYHTGDRFTGEARDLRAGRCIGACIEYAARRGVPLMVYVFSDGSVFSNGMIDNTPASGPDFPGGMGKGVWTGDNSSTAASYMLVYNPGGAPTLFTGGSDGNPAEMHQQIGWMRPDASVETASTPAANNVNLLVETVVLNYMALHGSSRAEFEALFPNHGLGNAALMDSLTAFDPLSSLSGGQIVPPSPLVCT